MNLFQALIQGLSGTGRLDPASDLKCDEAARWIREKKNLQIIDVREAGEAASGKILGSRLIPLRSLGERIKELKKTDPVLLYCAGGARSADALEVLKKAGFTQIAHIHGGFIAWQRALASGLKI